MTTLTVLHPKGGVGRSTTVHMLGAELALRGHRVALIDRDQGQHLSRILQFYPLAVEGLVLGDRDDVDVRIIDTAPEVDGARALGYLREADWALVPVKGLEAGSVLALPLLMDWLDQAHGARLLGFLPTMYKARRGEARLWLDELHKLAEQRSVPVFPPIGDLASLAAYRLDSHPNAPVAIAVEQVLRSAALSRAPVSLVAISAVARAVPAVQDRIVYEVPVADVVPSPRNPRHRLDGLDELAESIRTHGLLQPIVVRRATNGYELVAGHRRLVAVQYLGWSKVPAVCGTRMRKAPTSLRSSRTCSARTLVRRKKPKRSRCSCASVAGPRARSGRPSTAARCASADGCECSRMTPWRRSCWPTS